MEQPQVFEGTPMQIVMQVSKLPTTRTYRVTVTSEDVATPQETRRLITFGMFPQLATITEEDFRRAEWQGEEIEL